jgi:biotin carboxylase
MGKTILIVSGGIEAADAAKRAREMGLTVVVADQSPEAPAFAFADSCLIADAYGASETAAAAERYSRKIRKIDGVICVAADAPLTAARVAAKLGLAGISTATAELASDRLALNRRLLECGVPVPWSCEVTTVQALQRVAIERGNDLVIKPVDGSRGVQRIARVADLARAFARARGNSPTQRVMVEQYLDGPQVSTESILIDGRCHTLGFRDRNYEHLETYAPFFVENGGALPSSLSPDLQMKVKDVAARAVRALGVSDGTVESEIVVHKGEPHVIALSPRLSGGFFCTREIRLNTGVDFIGCAIKIALGESVPAQDLAPRESSAVVRRHAFADPGRVVSIDGAEDAKKVPGIADILVTARPGDVIAAAGEKPASVAMVLATGISRETALAAANDAIACIKIKTA